MRNRFGISPQRRRTTSGKTEIAEEIEEHYAPNNKRQLLPQHTHTDTRTCANATLEAKRSGAGWAKPSK